MEDINCLSNPESQKNVNSVEKVDSRENYYKHAAEYWSQIPPTVDGMLGGYGHISSVDINGSNQFLRLLFKLKSPPGKARALDCGAGIGRITKKLLFNHFEKVDLVEQNPAFVDQARVSLTTHPNMGNFYCSGLQDFTPEPRVYDIIWCQWVLGHLTDEDLVTFLNRCKTGLRTNGVIVIKENTTSSGKLDEDETDSSVTRPLDHLCLILQSAGLRCVKQKRQEKFPNVLYPVYMIATRPFHSEDGIISEDRAPEQIGHHSSRENSSSTSSIDLPLDFSVKISDHSMTVDVTEEHRTVNGNDTVAIDEGCSVKPNFDIRAELKPYESASSSPSLEISDLNRTSCAEQVAVIHDTIIQHSSLATVITREDNVLSSSTINMNVGTNEPLVFSEREPSLQSINCDKVQDTS